MTPEVSIIIPIYNAEPFIGQCLQSIISQPFNNWEIYLINDGSSDNSQQICQDFSKQDKRIKTISKENGGVSSARNLGLQYSKGKYITFIDIDDYIDKDFFAPLSTNAEEDIIFTQYKCFDRQGNITEGENIGPINTTRNKQIIKEYLSIWLHQNIMRTPWGKFIKREIIKDTRFPLGQTIGEDSVFMFNILSKIQSIKTDNKAFYMWRSHADFFIEKYQLPVDDAISYLINIYNAYRHINASSPHLEATLYFTFFYLTKKSIRYSKWKWFSRPVIWQLWKSINYEHKNIHKKKFKKYKGLLFLYNILDKDKYKLYKKQNTL